ncbi:MAG: hypothetical protein K0R08_57 [Solimicrobium sp.]|nr:hypothetical protein [Solimicrobium sp.]
MNKILTTITVALFAINSSIVAYAKNDEARANYKTAKESAAATYKAARARCEALTGNPKDVCIVEAKAEEKRSKANAEAQFENTPRARMKARIAIADADYAVAKEKCKAQSGNAKDVCMKKAKAAHTKAIVDARSSKEIGEIKSKADEEKRDADYKAALEQCRSLTGAAQDACVSSTKSKFGK